jgi:NAD(P)-dependent dehydrogenase (short-subunit alcohol dehydrogenase family)
MPTWFITGCSTGFGRALAQAVLDHGFKVALTARDQTAVSALAAEYPGRALALPLDVTDHRQVVAAVKTAEATFGSIDVLVNNAGYGYRAAVEEGERDAIEALFATNFFGPLDLIQQVLPSFRRRGSGTIVNLSSIAGRLSNPGSGFYSASKYALEGMSYALRQEAGPLGVKVIMVEPGPFRTDFAGRSLRQSPLPIADYAGTAGRRRKENDTMNGNQPGDPVKAAEAIITAVTSPNPPRQLVLGNPGIDKVQAELELQREEFATWEALGRATDF